MANFENTTELTFEAGAAVPQYRFVILNASGQAIVATAASEAIGISMNAAAAAGDELNVASVSAGGKAPIEASAAITLGDNVGVAASGKARTAATSDHIIGTCLQAAAADEDIVTLFIDKKITVSA
ncbi:MAG TPA: hypothetical protein VM285_02120 [Polyangia bacterium]|nr:hypothetical protein [Polyangia bacterium]